jgi:type I restriction enzyme R subunit
VVLEQDLEQLALTWFQDIGWDYRAGPDIAPDSDMPRWLSRKLSPKVK